ncbi:MAG TPA: cation-transporting P-type ATPase [Candidatus Saccharimonadales bacterium]|nr:cation-transporting P-type ATPase [Candidatus Saccharimonadales bacterium]
MGEEQKQLAYYRIDPSTALSQLQSTKDGLDQQVVTERQAQYGFNRLVAGHKETFLHKYLRQYKDLMIVLLIGCAVLSFGTGDSRTGIVLIAIVLFNTIIGFTQEFKAEKLMESLEKLVVPVTKVLRSGNLQEIASTELVPGDIVYIEAGDSVPADLRLIDESELATNDFALTGESNPSRKFTHAIESDVELANRHNLVFMGTTVAIGQAHGLVIATGMQTELGRIASLSEDTVTDISPLQREMNNIATRVTQGTVLLCAILLPVAMRYGNLPFKGALLFAIGIASSIIPQGLPAEINTALAQAANKLAKARALVKKLSAVETLGSTTIICTDKTGTLTKNQMTVESLMIGSNVYSVSGSGYEANGKISFKDQQIGHDQLKKLELFFANGVFASNAQVSPPDHEHSVWYCLGDPTEGALITLANKAGLNAKELDASHAEIKEFPFDSARKRMTSIREYDGKLYAFMKGAPENVLERSSHIWDQGKVSPLKKTDHEQIMEQHSDWANNAMRNLAYAYKILPTDTDVKKLKMDELEHDMIFLGLVSMIDPVREEVAEAMTAAHKAHIKVSIVTGDFAPTARAIAAKAGLAERKQDIVVVSGTELRTLDDARVLQLVLRGSIIFSRVSPEDKLRIVELVKNSGHVVAVTGDGINDAPALKRADIGVAMGKTGTDVAKQSADIILLDDSFHTLVGAVQQGRVIFQNIKKGTLSCFTSNGAELIVNLTSLLTVVAFRIPLALTVMEILAIDLIAELFPIAALGWDPADSEVMSDYPRDPHDHILNKRSILDLLWCGIIIGGFAFTNYLLFFRRHGVAAGSVVAGSQLHMKATALTYLTIVLCQLLNILQRRSTNGLFTRYQFHNKQLGFAFLASLTCVGFIIYNPVIAPYFGAGPLALVDWAYALGAAALFVLIREVQRNINVNRPKTHPQESRLTSDTIVQV